MIAVIDETTLENPRGFIYVVASVVLISDEDLARERISQVTAGRARPFHWVKEGPEARSRMVEALGEIGVVGAGFQTGCGRRTQDKARRLLLPLAVQWATREGSQKALIESRGRGLDIQDKGTLKSVGESLQVAWAKKSEPLLWVADAACGAYRELFAAQLGPDPMSRHASEMIEVLQLEVEYPPWNE